MNKSTKISIINVIALLISVLYCFIFGWTILYTIPISLLLYHLGHSIFAHRHFVHRNYKFSFYTEFVLNIIFTMMNMGSSVEYGSMHIMHHKHSGTSGDPHNFHSNGFFRTFFGLWDMDSFKIDKRSAKLFFRKPFAKWFHRHYFKIVFVLLPFFAPIMVLAVLWRSFSVIGTHLVTTEYSTANADGNNLLILKIVLWGDEQHAIHHTNGSLDNLTINNTWMGFDLLYYIAKILEKL